MYTQVHSLGSCTIILKPGKKRRRPAGSGTRKRKTDIIQPRRTRARIANRSAKIGAGELDTSFPDDENEDIEGIESKEVDMVEDLDLSLTNDDGVKAEEQTATGDEEWKPSYHIDAVDKPECSKPEDANDKKDLLKPDVMVDPLHSLFLDMIPSLGTMGVKSTSPFKGKEEVLSDPKPVPASDSNPNPNPVPEPGKKKKVELLLSTLYFVGMQNLACFQTSRQQMRSFLLIDLALLCQIQSLVHLKGLLRRFCSILQKKEDYTNWNSRRRRSCLLFILGI